MFENIEYDAKKLTEKDLMAAANKIFEAEEHDFEKIKSEKWYQSLFHAITLNHDGKKYAVKGIHSLAKLQQLFMYIYVKNYKENNKQLDEIINGVINNSNTIRKMYYNFLGLEEKVSLSELNEYDAQILKLFLGAYRDSFGKISDNVKKYNRGVFKALNIEESWGNLDIHQLSKLQNPKVIYRCFMEQCVVDETIDSEEWSEDIKRYLKEFELGDNSKENIKESVKREAESVGIEYFYDKYSNDCKSVDDSDFEVEYSEHFEDGKLEISKEELEILYNIELQKTINDMNNTKTFVTKNKELKNQWIEEWKKCMSNGFSDFVNDKNAVLNWYSIFELEKKIKELDSSKIWFRLVLLEAMIFEPYYPLSLAKNKDGKEILNKKYNNLQYNKTIGDKYLEEEFSAKFYQSGYIKRLRKTYNKVCHDLSEDLKETIKGLAITAVIATATIITVDAFAPAIAVLLVGAQFPGLSGAALTSACLAYIGGGAIAAGGLGMAGGTMFIVGGGTILGVGVGAGVGAGARGVVSYVKQMGKKNVILQSAKLIVSVREIYLNDEKDIEYADSVYKQFVNNITEIDKEILDLESKEMNASKEEKKEIKNQIKNLKESVVVMKIAIKIMNKYNSSFKAGYECNNDN